MTHPTLTDIWRAAQGLPADDDAGQELWMTTIPASEREHFTAGMQAIWEHQQRMAMRYESIRSRLVVILGESWVQEMERAINGHIR